MDTLSVRDKEYRDKNSAAVGSSSSDFWFTNFAIGPVTGFDSGSNVICLDPLVVGGLSLLPGGELGAR